MAATSPMKLKLLYIIDILTEHSDEEHPMSSSEISEKLLSYGVTADRKSIYRDISTLCEYGYDIIKTRTPRNGFALIERKLELPEIRLMIDAVQAANFITPKKTKELISKLEGFLSTAQAQQLSRQVYMDYRAKHLNEEIYYSIDVINNAIAAKKKIKLNYFRRKLSQSLTTEFSVRAFVVSPYAMLWSNDHYYLVCNNEKYNNLMHLRVDRMKSVSRTAEEIRPFYEVSEYSDSFDVADYSSKTFNMFGGYEEEIELRCENKLIESVIDRFGQDIPLRASGENHFVLKTSALISDGLISWILQFGASVEAISPQFLRRQLALRTDELYKIYEKDI